jgi:hypothetical protein
LNSPISRLDENRKDQFFNLLNDKVE